MPDDKTDAKADPPLDPKSRDQPLDWPDRFGATRIPADGEATAGDERTDDPGKDDGKSGDKPS